MIRNRHGRRRRAVLRALALGGAGAGLVLASVTPAGWAAEAPPSAPGSAPAARLAAARGPSAAPSAPTGGDPRTPAEPDASAPPSPEASAGEEEPRESAAPEAGTRRAARQAARRVSCPSVAERLNGLDSAADAAVRRDLALLDRQIAQADRRLAGLGSRATTGQIRAFVLNPLRLQRQVVVGRVADVLRRAGEDVTVLRGVTTCAVAEGGGQEPSPGPTPTGGPTASPSPTGDGGASPGASPSVSPTATGGGPSPDDFVDIRRVRPNVNTPAVRQGGSRGTFVSRCGRNEEGHHNSDNVIVAPGVTNGAHHVHDYVGNLDTSGFSTNESLQAAGTTCANGDKSTHYWPVLRLRRGQGTDAGEPGGGLDGNVGRILRPASVTLTLRGNATAKVVAMPAFLRVITGDAKSFTNGTTNANARWTCTGFENRQLTDKYPLCPRGSQVVRLLRFQSCWDGRNTDSANHRTHVAFTAADGSCPQGFQPIPALEQRVTYDVPPGPVFALDSFPEQLHKPVTDHGDFINVMPDTLMRQAVACVNSGRRCG
ncbi:hypothetical protein Ssi03_72000 [Sphaerisporangium siamense]|uniref:DUF1996 domain-containing protein n=1 Tax=Sphaerisporangium siamense TaxID=795645 RepID=A0A7W7DAW4_9ACTN|nr:DUF1996 domain-containing protein [Sphaerisporangium siamense]MBB4703189.1 hypothetical protein [Sphaerisporangium siamense]GII89210.1 hypothetical protein Ssi03_72000 [Sphaerisporangium siamense]